MDCQDWKQVTFKTISTNEKKEAAKKIHSKKTNDDPEKVKMEPPKQLGQLIAFARCSKTLNQKQLACQLGISQQILSRWESNREVPSNLEIAKINKLLGVKLPKCKKVAIERDI
jgi:ribosome-binding protein aMBF1 (putative translation factor)